jgi:beta-glucanase (GH16 family)
VAENGDRSSANDHAPNPSTGTRGSVPDAPPTRKVKTIQQNDKKHTLAASNGYQINEQFTGTLLNPNLWEAMSYPKGYRNNEEQSYHPEQVKVIDGMLQITANRNQNGEWSSGEVHSKWQYTYGEFEVRLALSTSGPGVWPAAWLMGVNKEWPSGGEIDIFENINNQPAAYATIHAGGASGHWQLQKQLWGIDVTKFHTYKLVKMPGAISWWVDGIKQGEWLSSQTPADSVWPFEEHANFGLLNLAIGGNWPGPSDETTPNAITMYVDYFNVMNAR